MAEPRDPNGDPTPESTDDPPPPRVAGGGSSNLLSHIVVAGAAAAFAVWVYGWAQDARAVPEKPEKPENTAPNENGDVQKIASTDARPTAANTANPDTEQAQNPPENAPAADPSAVEENRQPDAPTGPLAIAADPEQLRVWHNTRVTLRAEPAAETTFARYVWHFEDGSDPEEGEVVAHVFPESVADRHVTLEAFDAAGEKVVVSKTLPIERLEVVPLDGGEVAAAALPRAKGARVLWVGAGSHLAAAKALATASQWADDHPPVAAIVVASSGPLTGADMRAVTRPVLWLRLAGDDEGGASNTPALTVAHDPDGDIKRLISGTAEVLVAGSVAFVAHDSMVETHDEAALQRTFRGMQAASAYDAALLVTPRPLSPLADGDQVAIGGFRLYEQALRMKLRAVVSATSEVAYDGRYGGVEAVAVGRVDNDNTCRRLKGHDTCQSPTMTLLELPKKGRVRTWHLRGGSWQTWLSSAELPAETGKYRR